MRGEEAQGKCPDIILARVPCLRGKADTSRYVCTKAKSIKFTKHDITDYDNFNLVKTFTLLHLYCKYIFFKLRYRSAGREVIEVLKKNCNIVERASVDEAYLDITQIVDDKLSREEIDWKEMFNQLNTTFIVGHSEINSNDEGLLHFFIFCFLDFFYC